MKERERISNLEELMAESSMRLDRLEMGQEELKAGQMRLEGNMVELAKNQVHLSDGLSVLHSSQTVLQQSMLVLTKVVRKNSEDISYLIRTSVTKDDLGRLSDSMMNRFDRNDQAMAEMRQDIAILKAR
jgi:hypothetical protein